MIKNKTFILIVLLWLSNLYCIGASQRIQWITTTRQAYWQHSTANINKYRSTETADILINPANTEQAIDGFGTCFNELGWTSLSVLDSKTRGNILQEMFAPGKGANFTICRMPIGANDFSTDWYSFDETDGDFSMANFNISRDKEALIPFIKAAKRYQPNLKLWASPWSPPSWMKYNGYYAAMSYATILKKMPGIAEQMEKNNSNPNPESLDFRMKLIDNGLQEGKEGHEGADLFIQQDKYFKSYALYFSKFIDAYRAEGINISMVMPQNEFNSAQLFPSCCWTAHGLAHFVGKYLGPSMTKKGVKIMFGTVERANEALVDTILTDADCKRYVSGCGFQWAGKDALPKVRLKYPKLKYYQTEQECGNGLNNWSGAMHSWDLMKHYFNNGVSAYMYWNTSLESGGVSHWGWYQNSLVVVDKSKKTFNYTPEYYIMKHVSHYVTPGSKKIKTSGTYNDVLCFKSPNNQIIVIVGNQTSQDKVVKIKLNDIVYAPKLKANSINTLVFKQ